jgi:hypothetical protein
MCAGGSGGGGATSPPARGCAREVEVEVVYGAGGSGGGGAMSPPARGCAREVEVEVVCVPVVVVVVVPRHLRLAFARGR